VLPEEDLEVKVSNFFTKIKDPLLTNLKLEFPAGVRVTKLYPNPLPDLFRGDQLVLAGRYSGEGEGDVVLDGTLNGTPKRMTQRVKFTGDRGNDFIAQLWAMRRVGWLLDEIRLRGESGELRDEVVDLARRYAIVTPYTSYLIVEDEARRNVPVATRSLQRLDGDAAAQTMVRKGWADLSKAKDGYNGALAGRGNEALKNAEAPGVALGRSKTEAVNGVVSGNVAPADVAATGGSSFGYSEGKVVAKPSARPLPSSATAVGDKLAAVEQQTRFIGGKTFTQNGEAWNDTANQSVAAAAKRNRVQFASQEYFDLLTSKPETSQWLALGRSVQFTLGGEFYEIYE
jgi:Ca-activated chloride channel family protein